MKLKITFKEKDYFIHDIEECSSLGKIRGLMFRSREKARALLFSFPKPVLMAIHSYFVLFPFIALWIDENDKLVERQIVTPFTPFVVPSRKFVRLVEIPCNHHYREIVEILS